MSANEMTPFRFLNCWSPTLANTLQYMPCPASRILPSSKNRTENIDTYPQPQPSLVRPRGASRPPSL
ncbi:hypothetical protein BDU57DRAFT_77003 [Ampelomyces quisqualis]|uniref:Uncharacterized protein n=1 Tax=Ampelomyces quisqualis TaxID=50730 RepID=A0A6A5QB18_AMPQU|nr:hypothetical protein BDU57DRAFT_77003 [Ampelomyces quisqualis]